MDEASGYHSTQFGRKSFLSGSRGAVCGVSVRLLWPTADIVLLHIHGSRYFGMVRGGNELQFLLGGADCERVLFHRGPSGEHSPAHF